MTNKQYATLGIASVILFWLSYFMMVAQRPEYSFLTKAISELGSVDAPQKWIWNICGYIVPGTLIAIFSIGLYRHTKTGNDSVLPLAGIFLSGIFMVLAGIFPGDFNNKKSLTMLLHTVGSFGSYLFFLAGAFSYPRIMKKTVFWTPVIKPGLFCVYMTIVFGSWVFIFPAIPAVGQRIVFAFYFLWILFNAIRLYLKPVE